MNNIIINNTYNYDHTTNINMIEFINNKPVNVISEIPYPLGTVGQYCSFCCSDFNTTSKYLNNNKNEINGITYCDSESCIVQAHIALGYAYSVDSPLILLEPINSHKLNLYDDISYGYITYMYICNNNNIPQLYAHLEYKAHQGGFYHSSENILFSELLNIPENTSVDFISIMTFNCSKYGYYSFDKYNMYKHLILQSINSVLELSFNMNNLKI